jgi:hypothetical protein
VTRAGAGTWYDETTDVSLDDFPAVADKRAGGYFAERSASMTEADTLDAVRENADAVSRLIDQHLPEGESGSAQDVVNFTRFLLALVRNIWEAFQAQLDKGLEAGRARHAAASASLACDGLLRVVALLEAAQPGDVGTLAELLAAVPRVREIQKAARGLVDLLNAPAPPADEERLAQGMAAVGRGDFEDTAAIVGRLQAGGEL